MPKEDEYITGEFYSREELRRGFNQIVDQFADETLYFDTDEDEADPLRLI